MSYLEYAVSTVPSGPRKLLHLNWPLVLLTCGAAGFGFLMLYSVAGGEFDRWAGPQLERFGIGMALMFVIALVPIWFWRNIAGVVWLVALALLVGVEVAGKVGMGAQRWIDVGPVHIQPSEVMKLALVMLLAAYYDWLGTEKVSRPLWVLLPVAMIALPTGLVLMQPDLGTALMLVGGGAIVMFAAGVSLWYFGAVIALAGGAVAVVLASRGTAWQLLHDYQFRRIDTFFDPSNDPLGAGYHITQAKIALGSGGWAGRGWLEGTQSRLNFLPEKHTDFIFTSLAEEFGFVGAISLLTIYGLVLLFFLHSAMGNRDRFGALVTIGIAGTFFLFFAVNMAMVMGLAPVVGVPLPLVSYGGTAMMILLIGFGVAQSAHVHRPRSRA